VITQDDAVAEVLAKRTVSLDVAAASIPMGRNKAHRLARERGELLPGVPVYRKGDFGYVVPTPALRRKLQFEDFTVGTLPSAAVPPAVKTGEGRSLDDSAPRLRADNLVGRLPTTTGERNPNGRANSRPVAPA
jgi:hypothetical protein